MRPYLAILVDSFREAMASRVLWVLFAFITVMLLALVPFHWNRVLTTELLVQDVLRPETMRDMAIAVDSESESVRQRLLWKSLPDTSRHKLRRLVDADQDAPRAQQRLGLEVTEALNDWIQEGQMAEDPDWASLEWTDEGRLLLEKDRSQLKDGQRRRLHRLAIETVFPRAIRARNTRSVVFRYLTWDIFGPIPMSDELLQTSVDTGLAVFLNLLVGFVGVFTGVLATASWIPRTFESGSISLLLSKPITRPALFLTKFLGGCSFVLLSAAFLVVGLWLIAGWRWGMWNHRLLWSIPIFLLVFAIYYSVSALSGLVWRNTVVSIAVTVLFWFLCFAVGQTRDVMRQLIIKPQRLISIQAADDTWIGTSENQRTWTWYPQPRQWQETFGRATPTGAPSFVPQQPLIGPIFDAQHDRLVAIVPKWPSAKLLFGYRREGWARQEVTEIPAGISDLFLESDGRIIGIDAEGVVRMVDDPAPNKAPKLFGIALPVPANGPKSFDRAGPDPPLALRGNATVAHDALSDRIFIVSQGTIWRLDRGVDRYYQVQHRRELADLGQSVLSAAAGSYLVTAFAEGLIQIRDTERLDLVADFTPFGKEPPRSVSVSPQGRWLAVLFHTDQLWLYDTQTRTMKRSIPGQGDISAITWISEDCLVLVDRINQVRQITLPNAASEERTVETFCRPRLSAVERAYVYAVAPLYRVFPKPGKLEETINFALRGSTTIAPNLSLDNLKTPKIKTDPWGPVWSGLTFMATILVIGCIYVSRQDF